MNNGLLGLLAATLAFIKSVEFIYLFQVKEYRLDRIFAHIHEEGFFTVLYGTKPKLPAKSARNLLIFALNLIGFVKLCLFFFLFLPTVTFFVLFAVMSPIVGFVMTLFAVYVTGIIASWKRKRIIARASRKIAQASQEIVFIGITGSYGKTSTKEFLYQILKDSFKVAKTDENMNTDVGVAMSIIKNVHRDTQYFIAEAGAYRPGEIARIGRLIHPTYAVMTAIGNQHLALFGSREALVAAKKELLDSLPAQGTAYISRDIPEYDDIIQDAVYTVRSFSTSRPASIRGKVTSVASTSFEAQVTYKKKSLTLTVPLIGVHNLHNLLPCIGLALDLGMNTDDIKKSVGSLAQPASKLALHKGMKGSTILEDSYNSSLEGFLAAVSAAAAMEGYSQKIIVSRGILELGEEREKSYQKVLKAIVQSGISFCTTDPIFKKLDANDTVSLFPHEKNLLKYLTKHVDGSTLLVIEGKFAPSFMKAVRLNRAK